MQFPQRSRLLADGSLNFSARRMRALPVSPGVCLLVLAASFACVQLSAEAAEPAASATADHLTVAVEALQRLKGMDLDANPALRGVVLKVIDSTKGTAQFVELVRDFKIKGQEPALVDYAAQHPGEASGADALRLVLKGDRTPLTQALAGSKAAPLVECLGNTAENSAVPLLESVLKDASRDVELRKKAVHALVQTHEGAQAVLQLAQAGQLPGSLQPFAGTELRGVHWPEIASAATNVLASTVSEAAPALPPISQLVTRKGDRARGQDVFNRESVGCFKCHQVNGRGTDFGPNLSEIGTKLAKEAIYEAILDPSAGIAFGYEAWQVELKNGDEAFGLLASETNDEIAIKAQTGIVTRYKKSEVASKTKLKTSIMPNGLPQLMTEQDLVDLVEYLSSLKKPTQTAQQR